MKLNCTYLLHTTTSHCFNTGTVLHDWNTGLIKLIPKADNKAPYDPKSYIHITLILILCQIYADTCHCSR